jgi:hypothetical protein
MELDLFGDEVQERSFETDAMGFLIDGFGGKYTVFDGGKVVNTKTGKELARRRTAKGYVYVHLWHNNKGHGRFVHRLLMQSATLVDGKGLEVNHLDGNKANNKLSNLEWCTSSQNKLHSFHVLKNKHSILLRGCENPNSKPVEGLDSDGRVVVKFSCAEDARKDGYQPASICHAITGVLQKKHRGLFWRHATPKGQMETKI